MVSPYAAASIEVQAGLDLFIAKVGIGVQIELVKVSFPATVEAGIGGNYENNCLGIQLILNAGGGDFYAYVNTIFTKEEQYTIYNWGGAQWIWPQCNKHKSCPPPITGPSPPENRDKMGSIGNSATATFWGKCEADSSVGSPYLTPLNIPAPPPVPGALLETNCICSFYSDGQCKDPLYDQGGASTEQQPGGTYSTTNIFGAMQNYTVEGTVWQASNSMCCLGNCAQAIVMAGPDCHPDSAGSVTQQATPTTTSSGVDTFEIKVLNFGSALSGSVCGIWLEALNSTENQGAVPKQCQDIEYCWQCADSKIQATLPELTPGYHCNWKEGGWYVEALDQKFGCMPSNWTDAYGISDQAQNSCTKSTCPGIDIAGSYTSVNVDGTATSTVQWQTLYQSMCKAQLADSTPLATLADAQQQCIAAGNNKCGGVMETPGMVPGMQDWHAQSGSTMCTADGSFYSPENAACNLQRTCSSNSGLDINACPLGPVVWGVTEAANVYYTTSTGTQGTDWINVPGKLKQISVDGNTVWGVNSDNAIYWNTKLSSGGSTPSEELLQMQPTAGQRIPHGRPKATKTEEPVTEFVDAVVSEAAGNRRRAPPPPAAAVSWYNVIPPTSAGLKQVELNSATAWGVNSDNQVAFASVEGTLHYVPDCSTCNSNNIYFCNGEEELLQKQVPATEFADATVSEKAGAEAGSRRRSPPPPPGQTYFVNGKLPDTWTVDSSTPVDSTGYPCTTSGLSDLPVVRNSDTGQIFVLEGGAAQQGQWTILPEIKTPPGGVQYISVSPSGAMVWATNTSGSTGVSGAYMTIGGNAANTALSEGTVNIWHAVPSPGFSKIAAGEYQVWGLDLTGQPWFAYSKFVLHPLSASNVSSNLCNVVWPSQPKWWDESTEGPLPSDWIISSVDTLHWGCNFVSNQTGVVLDSSDNYYAVQTSDAFNGHWTKGPALPDGQIMTDLTISGNLVWAISSSQSLFYSTDGALWVPAAGALVNVAVSTKALTPPIGAPPQYYLCELPLWNTYNVKIMTSGTVGFEEGVCMSTYPFNGSRRRRGKVLRLNTCNTGESAQNFQFILETGGPEQPKNIKTGYIKSPGGQCLVPDKSKEGAYVTLADCGANQPSGQQWVFNEHLNQLKSNDGSYCLDASVNLAKKSYNGDQGNQNILLGNCDSTNRNQQWQLEGATTVWGPSTSSNVYLKGPNTIADSQMTQSGCSLNWEYNTGAVASGSVSEEGKITNLRTDVHGMPLKGSLSADGQTISWNTYPAMTFWKNNDPVTPPPTPE